MKINVRELIDPEPNAARLSRAGALVDAEAEAALFGVKLLSTCPAGTMRDLYRAVFQPSKPKASAPHPSGTIEHVILIAGKAKIGPAQAPETLLPGDYLTFSGDQPHVYEALDPNTTAVIIMETK